MKTMTCKQLGGACDKEFHAETFQEIADQAKLHGMQMFQEQDAAHLSAMAEIQERMTDPAEMMKWFADKQQEFEALPDNQ